jgi:Kef-type K+ transport system membrane component KefB
MIVNRNLLFYIAVLLLFGTGIYFILKTGSRLETDRRASERGKSGWVSSEGSADNRSEVTPRSIRRILSKNLQEPLSILLLQMIIITLTARAAGSLFIKLGQPAVIGEMAAGILLGPSLLGLLFPGAVAFLFPASSMGVLRLLSQLGVVIFMFVVGMQLNTDHLREKSQAAVMVSHASILLPFFLGVTFSLSTYGSFAPPNVSFSSFALFMGVAMSITAFPVLARIIQERGMTQSYLGSTAIACAAVDDVTAWCMLAVVVAVAKADALETSLLTIALAVLFVGVMLFPVKSLLGYAVGKDEKNEWGKGLIAAALVFAFASACFTEVIGIHALFGAFLAGVIMPSHSFRSFLTERLEAFSAVSLLPLFFAFTGLRTQLNLLDDWRSWLVCLGVIAVAIVGKLGGSMLAARWSGMSWQDSFSLGALMNTRGLVELIVLNIGYDLGVISTRIFAILVLMALVTTSMTGPFLSIVRAWQPKGFLTAQGISPTSESPSWSGGDCEHTKPLDR